jgi:hypothetical protein
MTDLNRMRVLAGLPEIIVESSDQVILEDEDYVVASGKEPHKALLNIHNRFSPKVQKIRKAMGNQSVYPI